MIECVVASNQYPHTDPLTENVKNSRQLNPFIPDTKALILVNGSTIVNDTNLIVEILSSDKLSMYQWIEHFNL